MINFVLPVLALAVVCVLFLPTVRHSLLWRATVTPLASIIGSGFLIAGPLLSHIAGRWAPVAMLAILILAYAIGAVLRFNIRCAEPLSQSNRTNVVTVLERLSDTVLGFAYIVSVAFYLRLLAAFVLSFIEPRQLLLEQLLTSGILIFIGAVGWLRGLSGLEKLEESAVAVKLAIITALLLGLAAFDWHWLQSGAPLSTGQNEFSLLQQLQLLGGMLLIVQGFETSRYLGDSYSQALRVRSMRYAQLIAGAIYLLFVVAGLPLLIDFHGKAEETAIIELVGQVAIVLPAMLVVAAAMSQFSAAVADTAGAGGLFSELSRHKVSTRISYVALVALAIALIWSADVFAIVTIASRCFAGYYLLQCLVALAVCWRQSQGLRRNLQLAGFTAMALLLLAVVLFAIPAEQ